MITISLAKAYDRTSFSVWAAAIVASSVLEDTGIVSQNDICKVIDRSKSNRKKSRTQEHRQQFGIHVWIV